MKGLSYTREEVLPSIRICRAGTMNCGAIIVEVPASNIIALCDNIATLWSAIDST